MTVEASGVDAAGQAARAVWSLVAEAGDGPAVPTLPALAAIRALADGRLTERIIDLATIAREFTPYRITTRTATHDAIAV
jgi:hypothetical protein